MKTLKNLFIILAVIVLLPLLAYASWLLKKGQHLNVVLVNKSFIEFKGSENQSFNYILNEQKILSESDDLYDLKRDHFGISWEDGEYNIDFPRLRDISRTAERTDILYYADTWGIKESDIDGRKVEYDHRMSGGLNNSDYTLIRHIMELKRPLIIECSFFGTRTESLVKYNIERILDLYYLGWIGKYYADLAEKSEDERLSWMDLYTEYKGETPEYNGPGIVFINFENKSILVLEEGRDINTLDGLIVSSDKGVNEYKLPKRANFQGWFSVMHQGQNINLSTFDLNPTEEGRMRLNNEGLSSTFPALIKSDENMYFMAGDFGKSNINLISAQMLGINRLVSTIHGNSMEASNFFYAYYQPLMRSIVYNTLKKQNDNSE